MIAITAAAATRGWVAVPPNEVVLPVGLRVGDHYQDLPGVTVAVVERDAKPIISGNYVMDVAMYYYTLAGFAEVAEVLPIIGGDTPQRECVTMFYPGVHVRRVDDSGSWTQRIDLPHAEPGGLALRLEPISVDDAYQLRMETLRRIGEPVTVVDLVGAIGRWER